MLIEIRKYLNINEYNRITKLFKFISELLSVVLERFNLENIEENLLLMEEQNRIANEMHDSVSQRLFSISFGLHGILGKLDSVSKDVLTGYLTEIQESSNEAMKELRKAIYKLSSKKNGDKYLQKAIKSIANSISILNDIQTELNFSGKEYYLNYELKKSILRIIREACSNAVKHGNCKNIVVSISIGKESVNLSIQDDGCGFIFDDSGDKYGLGLSNMKTLTKLFHGNINIKSDIGIGTKIEVVMPIHANNLQKGAMAI